VRPYSLLRGGQHSAWGYRSATIALPSVTCRFCDDRRMGLVDLSAGYRYTTRHNDRATTMIYTHILQQGGQGVSSPLDDLGV
jgi:hypothetical protein